jgi:hypothetical protein
MNNHHRNFCIQKLLSLYSYSLLSTLYEQQPQQKQGRLAFATPVFGTHIYMGPMHQKI